MHFYLMARIICDEVYTDNDRACCAGATYEAPMTRDTQQFAADAKKHFETLGWRVGGGLGFCLCPDHAKSKSEKQ